MAENLNGVKLVTFPAWGLSFDRNAAAPLDKNSLFYSKEEADTYASTSPIAYVGQIVSVVTNDTVTAYIINNSGKLDEVGSASSLEELTSFISGKLDKTGGTITGDLTITGNLNATVKAADKLSTPRTIMLTGDVDAMLDFDGSEDVIVDVTIADDSHNHVMDNITGLQTALLAKAGTNSPTFTGTPKSTNPSAGDNSTRIATTAFVQSEIDSKIAAADAMIFKGTIGTNGTITSLPLEHKTGWSYKVVSEGTYAGIKCEVGDLLVCLTDGTTDDNGHWTVVQTNIDGAVTGPASSLAGQVAVFDGTSGKVIKDSGFTIEASVPADAQFTDTRTDMTFSEGVHIHREHTNIEGDWYDIYNVTNTGIVDVYEGSTDGTIGISYNASTGSEIEFSLVSEEVPVKGLKSAAFTESSEYAPSSHVTVSGDKTTQGHVYLTDSINSDFNVDNKYAATPFAVKTAYDLASAALPKSGGTISGDLIVTGKINATIEGTTDTANRLSTARTIMLTGDVDGQVDFDGSEDAIINVTVADDSHNHIMDNIDGLETALLAKAPVNNPTFTGTPKAPTASAGTNNTQIATTEFVATAISNQATTDALNYATKEELLNVGDSLADVATSGSYNDLTDKPTSLKNPTSLTLQNSAGSSIGSYDGSEEKVVKIDAATVGLGNVTNESKATMFASPTFTGTPTAPTAALGTKTTQVATTEFVDSSISELNDELSAVAKSGSYNDLSGTPTSLKNPTSLTLQNSAGTSIGSYDGSTATTVKLSASTVGLGEVTNESKETMFASPEFTGIPTAPTATVGTNTTQIATTEFVATAIANKTNSGTADKLTTARTIMLTGDVDGQVDFDGSEDAIINVTVSDDSHNHIMNNIDGLETALLAKASVNNPTFTGTPKAPTAEEGANSTQIATTAFVQTELGRLEEFVEAGNFDKIVTSEIYIPYEEDSLVSLTTSNSKFVYQDDGSDFAVETTIDGAGITVFADDGSTPSQINSSYIYTGTLWTEELTNHKNDIIVSSNIDASNMTITATKFKGDLEGNASTATKDGSGNVIVDTYATKTELDNTKTEVKSYTDTEIAKLVNSAPETLDTLGEIATALADNEDVVEALNTAIGTKANDSEVVKLSGDQTIAGTKTFTSTISGSVSGNAGTADKLTTARTIMLTGDVDGQVDFDGSEDAIITVAISDDSHNHIMDNIDGLETALLAKAPVNNPTFTGTPKAPTASAGNNTTQIATTEFVTTAVANQATTDASIYATKTELSNIGDSLAKVATSGSYNDLSDKPTSLKNPTSLTLQNSAGSSIGSYDGSTATTVKLEASTVGLGNVTNESKATMFTNAALTGTPTAPTAAKGTSTTQIATTEFVSNAVSSGNSGTADKLKTPRTIMLTGGVDGSGDFDGSEDLIINVTVADDAHSHIMDNIDGLETALLAKAPVNNPTFTGTPKSTTPADGDNSTRIATTAFVTSAVAGLENELSTVATSGSYNDLSDKPTSLKNPTALTIQNSAGSSIASYDGSTTTSVKLEASTVGLGNVTNESKATMFASPTFTGTPTAPTATAGTNTTQIATTAFVTTAIANKTSTGTADKLAIARTISLTGDASGSVSFDGSEDAIINVTVADDSHNHTVDNVEGLENLLLAKAPVNNPTLTGTPKAPTAAAGTNTTQIATTAFVATALSNKSTTDASTYATKDELSGTSTELKSYTDTAIANLVDSAPDTLNTLGEIATALAESGEVVDALNTAIATKANDSEVVKLSGNQTIDGTKTFTSTISGSISGNAGTATKLAKAGTITLSGDASGSVSFDGSDATLTVTIADDSHNHTVDNVEGLENLLLAKAPVNNPTLTGTPKAPTATAGTNTTQIATTAFVTTAVKNQATTDASTYATKTELANIGDSLADVATSGKYEDLIGTPTSLKNPTSLTLQNSAGTSIGSYDGSTATTVKLEASTVGLGNVTNESKATMFASPVFTGTPVAPTATAGTNSTQVATTAFVATAVANKSSVSGNAGTANKLKTPRTITLGGDASGSVSFDGSENVTLTVEVIDDSHNHTVDNVEGLENLLLAKAPVNNPTLTGTPKAPTASAGTNSTQIATTAFVTTAVANKTSVDSATKATQDASGNVITSTYATKNELSDATIEIKSYADTAIANLVNSAPSTLDTLGEIAEALTESGEVVEALNTAIATKANDSEVVKLSGNQTIAGTKTFSSTISGSVSGNAGTANKLKTPRTITLGGDASGSVSFDGSENVTLTVAVADDSHNHTVANVAGLENLLLAKAPVNNPTLTGTPKAPTASAGTNSTQIATTAFVTTAVANQATTDASTYATKDELEDFINSSMFNAEGFVYTADKDYEASTIYTLNEFQYPRDKHAIRVSLDGYILSENVHYEEVISDSDSLYTNEIKLFVAMKKDMVLDIWVAPSLSGITEFDEKVNIVSQAQEVAVAAAERAEAAASLSSSNVTTALGYTPITSNGSCGVVSNYETTGTATTINASSANSNEVGSDITISNGTAGTAWTKIVRLTKVVSVTLGSSWSWQNGEAPTIVAGGILVCCWCGSAGIVTFMSPSA